jgi:hypothetical protein
MTREEMLNALKQAQGFIGDRAKMAGIGDGNMLLLSWWKAMELAICELLDREPRLLTEEDFKDNPDVDAGGFLPCWVECSEAERTNAIEQGIIEPGEEVDGWTEINVECLPGHRSYNPNVRHWTGKPSEAQKREAKWNV